jgi:hypothetical protein
MDIILPAAQGATLVLGLAEDPNAWADRLTSRLCEKNDKQVLPFEGSIQPAGAWLCPEQSEAMVQQLAAMVPQQSEVLG